MIPDPGILTTMLNKFSFTFSGGFATLMPEALWLLRTLAIIEVVIVAVWWALTQEDALVAFLGKAIWVGAFIWLVTSWSTLTHAVITSFIQIGLLAGGGGLTIDDFTNPSTIARYGLEVTAVIFTRLTSLSGLVSSLRNPHMLFIDGLSALAIVFAYFLIAIQVFITLLEFYLVAMLSLILVPFGVFRWTGFIAERAFGLVIAFGIKLMVLAAILTSLLPVLVSFQLPADPTLNQVLSLLLASLALTMLCWHAPGIAAGIMAGAPSLTATTVAHTAVAAGATLALAGIGTAGTLRAGTSLTRVALRTGGAISQAYLTEGGIGGVGRLAIAVGQDTTASVTRGFRAAVTSGRVYSITRLNGYPGFRTGMGTSQGGMPRGFAQRLVGRSVPPSSHPQGGGLHAPLNP